MHQGREATRESARIENYPGVKVNKNPTFVVMPQFSLWRCLEKGLAFRYKSENLLQNERSAEKIFRTNLRN